MQMQILWAIIFDSCVNWLRFSNHMSAIVVFEHLSFFKSGQFHTLFIAAGPPQISKIYRNATILIACH